ncbi:MAG: molybdate ABC transporter substrate-binding protein [Acidimicrobiales bacterium]
MRASRRTFATVGLLLVAAACRTGQESETSLTIVAAASLTDALGEVATAFEEQHPGVDVQLTFDGSAKLATAIVEGAPADLFASADAASLAKVAQEGLTTGEPVVVATNVLQIVVPEGNPGGIDSLDDLTNPELKLSLCGPEVPCGKYAAEAFEAGGLPVPAAGDQESVKGVLTQVQLGEADAGIVYLTDVLAADGVDGVDLAPAEHVQASYPATVLADASNPELAATFLAFLTGAEAQAILRDHGFGPP